MTVSVIGDLVKRNIAKKGLIKQVRATLVCEAFHKILPKVNEKASEKAKALVFKNGMLIVAVLGSSWAFELQMQQHILIQKVNEEIGEKVVERIKFRF